MGVVPTKQLASVGSEEKISTQAGPSDNDPYLRAMGHALAL
jgi:hypothetical protein